MSVLLIYIVLFIISVTAGSIGYAKDRPALQAVQTVLSLIAGAAVCVWALLPHSAVSMGYYEYRVNGIVVGQGSITVVEAVVLGIVSAAVPNLLGLAIGGGIANAKRRRAGGDTSLSKLGKIVCILCLFQAVSGAALLVTVLAMQLGYVLPIAIGTVIFTIPALLLLRRWRGI